MTIVPFSVFRETVRVSPAGRGSGCFVGQLSAVTAEPEGPRAEDQRTHDEDHDDDPAGGQPRNAGTGSRRRLGADRRHVVPARRRLAGAAPALTHGTATGS
jgi:hypothetical protein